MIVRVSGCVGMRNGICVRLYVSPAESMSAGVSVGTTDSPLGTTGRPSCKQSDTCDREIL
eukprot:6179239-Pleurochrysis_carterae.AAC.1